MERKYPKREHLVEVAAALFNRAGYHGTGIDEVIAEAGVAKTTLYRHFASKDDLIVAALRRIDADYREAMRRVVDATQGSAREKLLATFAYLGHWFSREDFHGCPFVSAAAEYSDRSSPVFAEARLHKRLLVAYFEELARAADLSDPEAVAEAINLLHEGAVTVAHVTGRADAAGQARAMAECLLGAED